MLDRVSELLELGEPLVGTEEGLPAAASARRRRAPGGRRSGAARAYRFRPEAYRFVGVDDAVLRAAGVLKPHREPNGGRARRREPPTPGTAPRPSAVARPARGTMTGSRLAAAKPVA